MKIPKKIVDKYDYYAYGCANDNWNIANGFPTVEQHHFLCLVYSANFGICGSGRAKSGSVNMRDVKAYKESRGIE